MATPASSRRTRTDALRNRAHILTVAEAGFVDSGVELAMDAIAKRAGVGAGTLYRHFPTRDALVAAVLEERYLELERERIDIVREEADSLRALERWLAAVSTWMRTYDGLAEPLSVAHENQASPLAPTCRQVIAATDDFLERAQRDGHARPGVASRDLFMATLAVVWADRATAGPGQGESDDAANGDSGIRDILRFGWASA